MLNTYMPIETECTPGDASRFTDHVKRIISNNNDREILINYMAACVQYPGVKFRWMPVIQGAQGNGKTLLSTCVAEAIGWKYVHTCDAKDITNKFNAWLKDKLFCTIEEIKTHDKFDTVEALKPLITNPKIEIHSKGQNQVVGDNRANFMANMNQKNGVYKSDNDRRFCVIFTDQQKKSDIKKSGMDGDYFPKLFTWLENGGYAIVTHFLKTYPIKPELNPATLCHRAPETSSDEELKSVSKTIIEQEIDERINEGKYGFVGGWISSTELTKMLKEIGKTLSPNLRHEILEKLGFIKHPGLVNGRSNTIMPKEANKPVLYIKSDSPAVFIEGSGKIADAYLKDQEGGK